MLRTMCKGKIHRATVTEANLHYVGSLTIDEDLLELSDILPYEQVHVVNINNGQRLITYAIPGARGSGVMCLNGAAARHGQPGDTIIVISYAHCNDEEARNLEPRVVLVDKHNRPVPVEHNLAHVDGAGETDHAHNGFHSIESEHLALEPLGVRS